MNKIMCQYILMKRRRHEKTSWTSNISNHFWSNVDTNFIHTCFPNQKYLLVITSFRFILWICFLIVMFKYKATTCNLRNLQPNCKQIHYIQPFDFELKNTTSIWTQFIWSHNNIPTTFNLVICTIVSYHTLFRLAIYDSILFYMDVIIQL